MNMRLLILIIIGIMPQVCPAVAQADTTQIYPRQIAFSHGRQVQSLQLLQADALNTATADLSAKASWRVEPQGLARVDDGPVLVPVSDGEGKVVARLPDGREFLANIVCKSTNSQPAWSFENQVQPFLTKTGCNQGACHGSAAGKNGFRLSLRGYAPEVDHDALTRQAGGRRLVPGHPEQSLIVWKATGLVPHAGGARIAPDTRDFAVLSGWIREGAAGVTASTPKITRIEASPGQARFKSGQSGRVTVKAFYSDQTSADVTAWAKFGTTDETVLKVDDDGHFKAENPGEAFVTVWFSSQVATVSVAVPSMEKISHEIFARAPRLNKIDELNLAKLQSLGIPPSPDAGDSAWLRRIYLDTTGLLPTAARAAEFMADKNPQKRSRLIEELIKSEAATDYWAYQWSDLLLVSSNKLPAPAMWSFYKFVRESVAANKPWDQFAREIITARGGTLENGAGNYYVLHRDPTDLTETTSVAFLGLSLTCARCHNHPAEKWTQDQYYGFASLLSRVGLKDGPVAGDVVVSDRPDGEIMHPRRGLAMPPQALDANAITPADARSRREALADWMTGPENPLFARAIVNRVWKKLFGRGLIDPEDDLRATNPPTDAALLAWLEADFKQHGYDIRHLLRTILNSAVYARSSTPGAGNTKDMKFLSHMPPRRLAAEVLLDNYSQVTDVPTPFSGFPEKWRAMQLPDTKVANGFLAAFGRPERIATCSCERSNEPSISQALHLANGETLNAKLKADKGLIDRWTSSTMQNNDIVRQLFLASLTREPTPRELQQLTKSLNESVAGKTSDAEKKALRRAAVEDLFWAVLTSDEFLFNH